MDTVTYFTKGNKSAFNITRINSDLKRKKNASLGIPHHILRKLLDIIIEGNTKYSEQNNTNL
jgi:hypothetical protein